MTAEFPESASRQAHTPPDSPASADPGVPGHSIDPRDPGETRAVPAAPPTSPPFIAPRREQWPSVVGIIAIVLGAIGVLSSVWNALGMLLVSAVASGQGAPADNAPPASSLDVSAVFRSMEYWTGSLVAINLLLGGLAVLLIVAGIGLLRRRRRGAAWMVRWSILRIIAGIAFAVVSALMQRDQINAMAGSPNDPAASAVLRMGPLMIVVTAVFALVWTMTFPVFVLVWMGRGTVRKTIASWP